MENASDILENIRMIKEYYKQLYSNIWYNRKLKM